VCENVALQMTVAMTPAMRLKMLLEVTAMPRYLAGTISERYKGAIVMPVAIMLELKNRPATKAPRLGAKVCRNVPAMDRAYAAITTHFRPYIVVRGAAEAAPTMAPTNWYC